MKSRTFLALITLVFFILFNLTIYQNYKDDRRLLLQYISDWTESTLLHISLSVNASQQGKSSRTLKEIIDKASNSRPFLSRISLSYDKSTISCSSDESVSLNVINKNYTLIDENLLEMLMEGQSKFVFPVKESRLSSPAVRQAYIYLDFDEKYVHERLWTHAIDTLIYVYSYFLLSLVLVLALIYTFLLAPLKKITYSISANKINKAKYFLHEPNLLNKIIFSNFTRLRQQEAEIAHTLQHQQYLEGILLTIADINQLLIVSRSADELLQKACIRLAIHGDYSLVWAGFTEKNTIEVDYHSNDKTNYLMEGLSVSLDPNDPTSKGPVARSIIENKSILVNIDDIEKGFSFWQRKAVRSGFHALIALPMRKNLHSEAIGSLVVYTSNVKGFDPKEISMLEDLAGDVGFAIQAFKQDELLKEHLTLDNITKLSNRAILFDKLTQTAQHEIILIDLDRFKDINEVYGYDAGDFVLHAYARSLERFLIPFADIELYTMGANTYAFLLPNTHHINISDFISMLSSYTDTLSYTYEEVELVVSFTAGHAKSNKKCIEHAEMALLKAKKKKESFISFDSSLLMDKEHEKNILWQKRIKEAIKEDRIVPYFQAIIDNKTQKIIKYESLIRLISPEGEVISPYLFLDIAKKTRIYPELTKIMISKSIEVFKDRKDSVSINLSLEDISNPDIVLFLRDKITSIDIGKKLTFEILETEGIDDYEHTSKFISEFKKLGCSFSIDDFGSGYSSFEHILKLDVDFLKIDGSLVKNISTDPNAQIIVKHINNFAQDMGLQTIAEFVSTKESYDFVKELGITYSQGYYFHEPSVKI